MQKIKLEITYNTGKIVFSKRVWIKINAGTSTEELISKIEGYEYDPEVKSVLVKDIK
jgi:hypothetical protein